MKHALLSTRSHLGPARGALAVLLLGLALGCGGGSQPSDSPDQPLLDDSGEGGGAVKASSPKVQEGIDAIKGGDFVTAEAALAEARQDDPDDPQAAFYLGVAYEGLEDMQAAKKAYREALELDPELSDASVNLSAILLEQDENPKAALRVLKTAMKTARKHAGLLLNHALVQEALGDWPAAAKAYGVLVKEAPKELELRLSYAVALHKSGDRDGALKQVGKAATSKDLKVLAPAARMYGVLEAYDKCKATFGRAIKIKKLPELYVRRGLCRNAGGDIKGGRADYDQALKLDPKYAAAYLAIGKQHKEQGKAGAARQALGEAIDLGKGTPVEEQAKKVLSEIESE